MRDRGGERFVRHRADVFEAEEVEVPDQAPDIGAERERVTDEHPQDRYETQRKDALHDRPEHVLGSDHAAVEQREPRGHEHHHRGCDENESGISSIHLISLAK